MLRIILLIFAYCIVLFVAGCKKDEPKVIPTAPSLTSMKVTSITDSSALCGGTITKNGDSPIISKGICWGRSVNPMITDSKIIDTSSLNSFTKQVYGLKPGVEYHFRAFAINAIGTAYGEDITFITKAVPPKLSSIAVTNIGSVSATGGGDIISDGGAVIKHAGVCWSNSINPTVEDFKTDGEEALTHFESNLTGLKPGLNYHVRAYATNLIGTAYGEDRTFTTTTTAPEIISTNVISIGVSGATAGGNVTGNGGLAVTSRGVCWSTNLNPTILDNKTNDGAGTGIFTSDITGLNPSVTYHLRAYATNSIGTAYGEDMIFTTYAAKDVDGNYYHSVTIGTQVWLVENLSVKHYSNGDPIPFVDNQTQWSQLTSGAYCFHNNDPLVESKLGVLYNWYVTVDSRKISPLGWHVPSDKEWETLVNYLGGSSIAGAKMKETGTKRWDTNVGADNSSGFTAYSGGQRAPTGEFYGPGTYACFWTSTSESTTNGRDWFVTGGDATVTRYYDFKNAGFNVRCIKD